MVAVAIHQPNFFPWLGFFDKIVRADRFVFLDNVQMPLTGSSYTNRVSILMGANPGYLQLPVARGSDARSTIRNAMIAQIPKSREKVAKTVQQNYARAPFFEEVYPTLKSLILDPAETIGAYNEHAIRTICAKLDVPQEKLIRGSDLDVTGAATELLINIVKAAGGDTYVAGGGASGYQQDEMFAAAGVKLVYQNFRPRSYRQQRGGDFVAGLSIIDALMNLGFDDTAAMLKSPARAGT